MSTSKEYLDFILDRLSLIEGVTYKPMINCISEKIITNVAVNPSETAAVIVENVSNHMSDK